MCTYLQLLGIQVWHARPVVDHIVHERLCEKGVIQLIMTPAIKIKPCDGYTVVM